ncbi:hypothetical protein JK636_05405 [Clostridium sp. YIM B02515]|uniref:Uncharacterized protein n=1 Tax=Clostridium rhizosphaerae TaxID=2803861 RepID=A0ABS1T767_9CLOT|nr:hypothetical protein [Clostridium rhizosphaerae]MBL4935190.1 hypothetical protein [Clostridium rhizosphaerae]
MKISAKVSENIHTCDELAKVAGVSHDTYSKGKKNSTYKRRNVDINERM